MEIRKLTMDGLKSLLLSEEVSGWTSLPISPLRLASQAKNPLLRGDDIVMVLAIENNDLAGYMGALPDQMLVGKGKEEHLAWASCIWTAPAERGKGLAKILTETMVQCWQGKLILTEFTPAAAALYHKLDLFETFLVKRGYRYFYRPILWRLAKNRVSNNGFLLALFKCIDFLLNIFLLFRKWLKLSFGKENKYRAKEADLNMVADQLLYKSSFERSPQKNSWVFFNPWLSSDKINQCERYYFPTWVPCFRFSAVVFYDGNGMAIARLVFSRFNEDCKVISFLQENTDSKIQPDLKKSIELFFLGEKISSVLSFDDAYNEVMKQKGSLFFYKRSRKREYLAGKEFCRQLPPGEYCAGEMDGDPVFT